MVEKKRKLLPEITEALLRDLEERRIKHIRIALFSCSLVLILLF